MRIFLGILFFLLSAFLLFQVCSRIAVASPTRIYVYPEEIKGLEPGDVFTIAIKIDDVVDLYAWQFELKFNPSSLKLLGVSEGPFLRSGGSTQCHYHSSLGRISYWCSLESMDQGVSGGGTVAYLSFEVKTRMPSTLELYNTALIAYYPVIGASERIQHSVGNGWFGEKGGGCPVLKAWNDEEFQEIEKLNIHSEEGIDTTYSTSFKMKPFEENVYKIILEEKWYLLWEGSHIDYVKLTDSTERECKLIKAIHSKLGDVTSLIEKSDDERVETKPGENIELIYGDCRGNDFKLEIEGYNSWWRYFKLGLSRAGLIAIFGSIIVLIILISGVFKTLIRKYQKGSK